MIDSKDLIKKINSEIKGDAKPGDKEGFANEKILVFISFSMPKNSINELNQEASKYGAELYLRGIFEKSFKKTAEKILEVNPNEFKKYKIEKVPTFVLLKDGKEVSRLLGNVSLDYANSKLRESK